MDTPANNQPMLRQPMERRSVVSFPSLLIATNLCLEFSLSINRTILTPKVAVDYSMKSSLVQLSISVTNSANLIALQNYSTGLDHCVDAALRLVLENSDVPVQAKRRIARAHTIVLHICARAR